MQTCPECDGTGDCPTCDGTGTVPSPTGGTMDCPDCGGTGDCPECDGTGEEEEEGNVTVVVVVNQVHKHNRKRYISPEARNQARKATISREGRRLARGK